MKTEEELKKIIEEFNREQLVEKLTQYEIIKIKELLPKIEKTVEVHDRARTIIWLLVAGIPIVLTVWQIIERLHK